jgi:hypothetical protein
MEGPWTTFGWFLIAIGLLAAVLMFVFQPIPNPLNAVVGQKLPAVRPGGGPMTAVFFMALSGISSFMWVLIDLVDKKLRLVWIVPMVACCACGLQAIPHAFYMFMREN